MDMWAGKTLFLRQCTHFIYILKKCLECWLVLGIKKKKSPFQKSYNIHENP